MKHVDLRDTAPDLEQARALLIENPKVLKRKVRCLAAGNELDDPRVAALYTLACGRKFQWTSADWQVVLDRLDTCELTVGEWLDALDR